MLGERALHRAKLRHQFLDLAALQWLGENADGLADEIGAVAQRVGDAGAGQAGIGPEQRDTVAVRGVGGTASEPAPSLSLRRKSWVEMD